MDILRKATELNGTADKSNGIASTRLRSKGNDRTGRAVEWRCGDVNGYGFDRNGKQRISEGKAWIRKAMETNGTDTKRHGKAKTGRENQ